MPGHRKRYDAAFAFGNHNRPTSELYFGPPYLVDKQHHPVSSFGFCLLPFFASNRFWRRRAKNRLVGSPLLNDPGTVHTWTSPFFQ